MLIISDPEHFTSSAQTKQMLDHSSITHALITISSTIKSTQVDLITLESSVFIKGAEVVGACLLFIFLAINIDDEYKNKYFRVVNPSYYLKKH
ncbi:hypothetical protein [Paraglaciecola polaris]|uniref:hypothetical protein n=1 Tax=Paraglaciecola polaris TaxID=222814 RepID=UPI0030ECC689